MNELKGGVCVCVRVYYFISNHYLYSHIYHIFRVPPVPLFPVSPVSLMFLVYSCMSLLCLSCVSPMSLLCVFPLSCICSHVLPSSRYSGVSIGWGWSREKDTYAANNTVSFNAIHDYKLQLPHASLGEEVFHEELELYEVLY